MGEVEIIIIIIIDAEIIKTPIKLLEEQGVLKVWKEGYQ